MTSSPDMFSSSLFALADEEDVAGTVLTELKEASALITEDRSYVTILDSPMINLSERLSLIDEAFSSMHVYVLNFLKVLCEKRLVHTIDACAKRYENLYNEKNGIENVTVITAAELSDELAEKLQKKLERETGKTVVIDFKIDRSILGGIIVRTKNSLTDASLRARLNGIKTALASAGNMD